MYTSITTEVENSLSRLIAVARRDTGQSRYVANFLLAWMNAPHYGGFDFSAIRVLDEEILKDMKRFIEFLFDSNHKYPIDIGYEEQMRDIASRHRPPHKG